MNPWREEMCRLGRDIEHRSIFTPRVLDSPDITACVYDQGANDLMHEIEVDSEEYFGRKCVGMSSKLEFEERNTPPHPIMVMLEGGLLEELDEIDDLICAELPEEGEDDELRALVLKLHVHRHSTYCRGRTSNG